ncbi:MAG: hypothetical protein AAF573_13220 [Bacteroidota bacterium]
MSNIGYSFYVTFDKTTILIIKIMLTMKHINTKPKNDSTTPQKEIPDWFYFTFGMMLVLFSGMETTHQKNEMISAENPSVEFTIQTEKNIPTQRNLATLPDLAKVNTNAKESEKEL